MTGFLGQAGWIMDEMRIVGAVRLERIWLELIAGLVPGGAGRLCIASNSTFIRYTPFMFFLI
jgi:hypothetical protein